MGRHIRGLDALRGLAVAAVLLFHGNFAGFRGGFLGVSLFFTVSGFLITSLILRELGTGRVDLRHFWARRAKRLLPAACAVVVVVVIAAAAGAFNVHRSATDGIYALFYAANWHALASGQSYAELFSAPSPLLHYWSLAIEEQYYLLFPLVCWWCARRHHPRTALTVALLGALAVSAHAHFEAWGTNRMYYGTDVRIGEIALGALLALAVERAGVLDRPHPSLQRAVAYLQLPVLAIVLFVVATTSQSSRWLYHGGLLAMGLCWVVLVLAAVLDAGLVGRTARLGPLVGLGVISYGVYLVHWPLLIAVHPFHRAHVDAAFAIALSIGIAAVSYRFYESPIRFGDLRAATKRGLVRAGGLAAGAVALVAIVTPALTPAAGAGSPLGAYKPVKSSTAVPAGATPLRVLVIGDSTGGNLGGALARFAPQHPGLIVSSEGLSGCALSDATSQSMVRQGLWASVSAQCRHWSTRLASEKDFRPDIVLAVFGPTQVADLKLPGADARTDITHPDVQSAVRREAGAIRALFPRATFVWATAPRTFVASQQFPEADWVINDSARLSVWNNIVTEFAAQPHSARLDVAAYMTGAPGGWRDRSWRPDGAHVDGTHLKDFVNWTVERLRVIRSKAQPAP